MEWDEFESIFSEKIKTLQKCIIPLYRMNYELKKPEFVGSSIFCSYGPIKFIFSAKHVFEEIIPDRPWFPYSENEMSELQFEKYILANDLDLDIGIILVTNQFKLFKPISARFFGSFNESIDYQHLLTGYPSSSTKRSSKHDQRIKFQVYLTSAASNEEYSRLKVDKNKRFVVKFKKKNVYNEKKNLVTFPDPNGMSGGGVFQFNEKNHNQMNLVGLMTDWDIYKKNAIIATRIECINELFRIWKIDLPKINTT